MPRRGAGFYYFFYVFLSSSSSALSVLTSMSQLLSSFLLGLSGTSSSSSYDFSEMVSGFSFLSSASLLSSSLWKNEVSDLNAIFYSTMLWRRASNEESTSESFYFSCLAGGLSLRLPLPLRAGKVDMINQIYLIMIGYLGELYYNASDFRDHW